MKKTITIILSVLFYCPLTLAFEPIEKQLPRETRSIGGFNVVSDSKIKIVFERQNNPNDANDPFYVIKGQTITKFYNLIEFYKYLANQGVPGNGNGRYYRPKDHAVSVSAPNLLGYFKIDIEQCIRRICGVRTCRGPFGTRLPCDVRTCQNCANIGNSKVYTAISPSIENGMLHINTTSRVNTQASFILNVLLTPIKPIMQIVDCDPFTNRIIRMDPIQIDIPEEPSKLLKFNPVEAKFESGQFLYVYMNCLEHDGIEFKARGGEAEEVRDELIEWLKNL